MSILIYVLIVVIGLLTLLAVALLVAELRIVGRLMDMNKQLMLLVAGQEGKPDTLRALVASAKPPQGKIKGIADKKKKEENKPKNINYSMEIGVDSGL